MTGKIKILHLTFHMGIGGTEQVIYQLVKHADVTLFHNEIICIEGEVGPIGQQLQAKGTVFHVLNRVPGFDTGLIKSVRKLIVEHEADIIHCHQYSPYIYGVLAALFTDVKVIFTEHGRFHPDTYSWKRRLINPLLNRVTFSITAISEATREALAHYEWFPKKSIKVIYNGIEGSPYISQDRTELGLTDTQIVFGSITRFDTIKNLPMMIRAFAEVYKIDPNVRLLLVGDGDQRADMGTLVRELGVHSAVIFTGFQTDTKKYMSMIDIYVLSSFSEGTSMTLLEAMSLAKCCIVTAVGGNVEIINDQYNGLVVESDNTGQLATSMTTLAQNALLRQELGAAAKQTFDEKFDLNQMIEAFKLLYLTAKGKNPS